MKPREVSSKLNIGGKLSPVLFVLLIVAVLAAAYFYNEHRKTLAEVEGLRDNPRAAAQEEVKEIVGEVGSIVELPEGTPTVATVTDVSKLKGQAFFQKAQNGDKVLIYPEAKKAFLYRPSTKKIIEASSVNLGNGTATPSSQTSTPTPTPEL